MTRRFALLGLLAFVALQGTGCYHLRNCVAQFRANHPCLFPCAHHHGYAAPYTGYAGYADGCATCFSMPPVGGAAPVSQPLPGAIFGAPQPITNIPAPDAAKGVPSPMK